MKLVPWLGWLVFGLSTLCCVATYGKHWDFSGRYRMPTALLSPDGNTYRDGTEVDPFTLALVHGGIEQEAWLVMVGVLLVLLTAVPVQLWRHRKHMKAFELELRRIRGMRPHE